MSLIYFLIIGLIAGWLAGLIMQGRGFGIIGDIAVGVVGALIGGYIVNLFGVTESGTLSSILTSILGAIILLALVGLIRREVPPM